VYFYALSPDVSVAAHTQVVGPRHDPYARTTVTLKHSNGATATRVQCGLAGTTYTGVTGEDAALAVFGTTFDDADRAFSEGYEPDPMGHPSSYV
jgi:hypothetical protein